MKRLFDFISSTIGLLILSPILIIVSILIKLESKGPVFYKQVRVGINAVDFHIFKFRTMFVGSDKKGLLTVGNRDPRVTRVGYFLRKYKLDEIPQLINVFLGDMSLVGPRPEVRKYVDHYFQAYEKVLSVRPGITDYASLYYRHENEILKGESNPEKVYIEKILPEKLELNQKYIREHNFFIDIKIILQTIRAIFQ